MPVVPSDRRTFLCIDDTPHGVCAVPDETNRGTNWPVDPLVAATAVGRFIPEQPAPSSRREKRRRRQQARGSPDDDDASQPGRPADPLVAARAAGRFIPDQPARSSERKKRRRRQQARGPPDDDGDDDADAYSIATFCRRHGISESFFFKLQSRGEAPDTIAVGSRRLITKEAARKWRRQRAEASTA